MINWNWVFFNIKSPKNYIPFCQCFNINIVILSQDKTCFHDESDGSSGIKAGKLREGGWGGSMVHSVSFFYVP